MIPVSPLSVLSLVADRVAEGIGGHWAGAPIPGRLVVTAKEAVVNWARATFPGAVLEDESPSGWPLTQLAIRIFTPSSCHRMEIRGLDCATPAWRDRIEPSSLKSWILVGHACERSDRCSRMSRCETHLSCHRCRLAGRETRKALTLSLWAGPQAPDGCAACLPVPKDLC